MPRLTEQEQQEIIRYLEANKPLPDKFRFLLFEEKREVELVWNGKMSEVCNIVLPFQVIEQVDEPRAEKDLKLQGELFDPVTGRQLKGWTNKLIWGDNKLILSSLKNGPLREEIEQQGGLKLIYIDPPFDVGADFSMDIEIGGDTFAKKPNILEKREPEATRCYYWISPKEEIGVDTSWLDVHAYDNSSDLDGNDIIKLTSVIRKIRQLFLLEVVNCSSGGGGKTGKNMGVCKETFIYTYSLPKNQNTYQ